MEKKSKRLLSLALALVMVIGLIPNVAFANGGEGEVVAGKTANYRWETTEEGTGLTNITTEGYTANGFTENVGGTVTGRQLVQYYAELENTIILRPTDAWEIEWKATNSTGKNASATTTLKGTGRILLCSGPKAAATGAQSVYLAEMYAMCQYGGPLYASAYNQLGNKLASGADGRSGVNTYTIKNVPGEDGAVIQLYVNGEYAADLNKVYKTGTEKADADASALANATYCFNYIGDATSWNLGSPEFHYLEVRNAHVHSGQWVEGEDGLTKTCVCGKTETVAYNAYRWEITDDVLTSVATDETYTENAVTKVTGGITDGTFSSYQGKMASAVNLQHDKPWTIEWKASGDWSGVLLSSTKANTNDMDIIFKRGNTMGLTIGTYDSSAGLFYNYGAYKSLVKNYLSEAHVWRLVNVPDADGSNMVYLYIDGVEICAMIHYHEGASYQSGKTGDYLNGRDLTFQYFGKSSHLVSSMKLEYMEIWPNGGQPKQEEEHVCDFSIEQEVTAGADCENVGTTVWACVCGLTETRANNVYGKHDYYAETEGEPGADCKTPGENFYVCSNCGDDYTEENSVYGDHDWIPADCEHGSYCDICGASHPEGGEALNHDFSVYVETVKGANCQTPGYDVYKCSRCNKTEDRVNNEAVGDHIGFGEWYYNVEEDCVERSCACGETVIAKISFDVEGVISVFDDLNAAVAAAPAGTTIFLWEDTTVGDLELSNDLTVDIQGHVLTVTGYLLVDKGNRIVDFYSGEGLLKVDKDSNTLISNDVLYIWNGVDGYVLGQITNFQEMTATPKANTTVYYFLPEINPEVHEYLKAGSETTEVHMIVSLFWEKGGVRYDASVKYTDELINKVLDSYDPETGKYALAYKLTITGTDAIDKGTLKFYVSFVNGIWA